MLLDTIRINVSPKLFDLLFLDFIQDNWNSMKWEQSKVGYFRLRYAFYEGTAGKFEPWRLDNSCDENTLIAEIDRTLLDEEHIEIRIAALEVERPLTHLFINTFYYFLYEKWGVNKEYYPPKDAIEEGLVENCIIGHLSGFIHELFARFKIDNLKYLHSYRLDVPMRFPSVFTYCSELFPTFYTDPMSEEIRIEIISELQKRLQPIEELPGNVVSEKKKIGRPGLSDEALLYRLWKAEEAIKMRQENPKMTKKEIAKAINWEIDGSPESKLKKLDQAMEKYKRYKKSDPKGKLIAMKVWKERKIT